jgi:hypothetical protein
MSDECNGKPSCDAQKSPGIPMLTGLHTQSRSRSPQVSIILPTYNHLKFLSQCVHSLITQTFTDFELIIVNDGSTDATTEYLNSLSDSRIRVIHQTNQRLPTALNNGFKAAQGEFLTWVSADNYCAPMFLEALVGALHAHPEVGLAYSAFAWIDNQGRITGVHRDQDLNWRNNFKCNPGVASFLYRRECLETVGEYIPELEGAEDWDMWLRITETFSTIYVGEILYYYRLHSDSMTAKQQKIIQHASRKVFQKALDRQQGLFDLAKLYPSLEKCRDRAKAEEVALVDFGALLLDSPFAPIDLVCRFLATALESKPVPELAANLALAFARAQDWDGCVQCLTHLKAWQDPGLASWIERLDQACRARRSDLASELTPIFPPRKGCELFESEQALRPIFPPLNKGDRPRVPANTNNQAPDSSLVAWRNAQTEKSKDFEISTLTAQ